MFMITVCYINSLWLCFLISKLKKIILSPHTMKIHEKYLAPHLPSRKSSVTINPFVSTNSCCSIHYCYWISSWISYFILCGSSFCPSYFKRSAYPSLSGYSALKSESQNIWHHSSVNLSSSTPCYWRNCYPRTAEDKLHFLRPSDFGCSWEDRFTWRWSTFLFRAHPLWWPGLSLLIALHLLLRWKARKESLCVHVCISQKRGSLERQEFWPFDWTIPGGILFTCPEIPVESSHVPHSVHFDQALYLHWFWWSTGA